MQLAATQQKSQLREMQWNFFFFFPVCLCAVFSPYVTDQARTMPVSLGEQKLGWQSFEEVTEVQLKFFSHPLAQAGLGVKDYLEISAFKEQILPAC